MEMVSDRSRQGLLSCQFLILLNAKLYESEELVWLPE